MSHVPTNDERLLLTWENRVRLLANPSLWSSMLLVLGIPAGLLGLFFAFLSKRLDYLLIVPLGFIGVVFAIFFLVALVIDAFGGMRATFFLTSHGVRFISGKGVNAAASAAIFVDVLSGKPGLAGAGLLAESEQSLFIPWHEISAIRVKASRHYVQVRGNWGDKPIGLYCTSENFREVLDTLRVRSSVRTPAAADGLR